MIFHENCLPADNSHDISIHALFVVFEKETKLGSCHLLQNIGGALRVNYLTHHHPLTVHSIIFLSLIHLSLMEFSTTFN